MVSDHWSFDHWTFTDVHLEFLEADGLDITQLPTPQGGEDDRVWMPDLKGIFSVSSSKEIVRQKYPPMEGTSLLWRKEMHPVLAARNWKFTRGICAIYDFLQSRFKVPLAKKCCLCGIAAETLEHVLFSYSFAARAWTWITHIFGLIPNNNLVTSYKASKGMIQMVRELWLLANLVIKSELWALRNKGIFDQKKPNWNMFFKRVLKLIQDSSVRLKGYMKNCAEDVVNLDYFRVHHRRVKFQQPIECFWHPHETNEIQL